MSDPHLARHIGVPSETPQVDELLAGSGRAWRSGGAWYRDERPEAVWANSGTVAALLRRDLVRVTSYWKGRPQQIELTANVEARHAGAEEVRHA